MPNKFLTQLLAFCATFALIMLLLQRTNAYQCGTVIDSRREQFRVGETGSSLLIKISKGEQVWSNSDWPWMVALFAHELGICGEGDNKFCCTASIIGPRHVLTAAHCFMVFKEGQQEREMHQNIFLRLGSYNHSSEDAIEPHLEQVIVHADFNTDTFVNDLAIIKLSEPLTFTNNVKPICLAHSPFENDENENAMPNNVPYIIVGWGRQHEAEYDDGGNEVSREADVQPEILREGHAKMRYDDDCAKMLYDKLGLCLDERICMEIGIQNSEPGDSGGPLLTHRPQAGNAVWTQIGVSSIAALKNQDRVAILYTRVSDYCDWIEQNTEGEVKCM